MNHSSSSPPDSTPESNPFRDYAFEIAERYQYLARMPVPPVAPRELPPPRPQSPGVLVFSPHPDDECIVGGLALRLRRAHGWRAVNVAVTCGSRVERQRERIAELRAACQFLGFDLLLTAPNGLSGVQRQTRDADPAHWQALVAVVVEILQVHRPRLILYPHAQDQNSTHMGTHDLVVDALGALGDGFSCLSAETEFWAPMAHPNLLLELAAEEVADLVAALTCHVGEIERNPYHLRLPAWMMDNVRRGGELVGPQGGAAPGFVYGTLYWLRRWARGHFEEVFDGGRFVGATDPVDALLS